MLLALCLSAVILRSPGDVGWLFGISGQGVCPKVQCWLPISLGPPRGRRMPSPAGTSTVLPFVLDCESFHLESALFLLLKVKMRENQVCEAELFNFGGFCGALQPARSLGKLEAASGAIPFWKQ